MKLPSPTRALTALVLLVPNILPSPVAAIDLDPTQPDQVRQAAKNVAEVLVSMYANTEQNKILSGIPGLLPYPPYFWWEAGAMFGQLIDYWYYTNDSSYNTLIKEGILHQIGEEKNFVSLAKPCFGFAMLIMTRCLMTSPRMRATTTNFSGLSP